MIDKTAIFTFTLLYRDEDEKVILITSGETPAKTEEEADSVLSSKNEDEAPAVDQIISKMFKDTEPGSEESITASLQEFEDKYDISLEELEEEVGEDLDNDQEKGEDEEHVEKVLDAPDSDDANYEGNPTFALISIDTLTDPTSIMPGIRSRYSSPTAFLDEEDVDLDENNYDVVLVATEEVEEEEPVLEEGASPHELVKKFIDTARASKKGVLNIALVTALFNNLHVTSPDAKLAALRMCLRTGNIKLYQAPGQKAIHGRTEIAGEPLLVVTGTPDTALPAGSTEVALSDASAVNQALSKFVGQL